MQTYVAEIGEIVRAQRRDDEEIEALEKRISWVIKELAGQRTWMRLYPYLRTAAMTAYFSCTTLAGVQTLGEEYVKLFETESSKRAVPSFGARFLFVVFHAVAPMLSQLALQRASRVLAHPSTSSFLGVPMTNNPKGRRSFQLLIEWIRSTGIPQLYRIHLAFFYIFGVYYNISRRTVGIRYLSLNPQTDLKALKVYKFLGFLTLAQTALSLTLWLVSAVESERSKGRRKSSGTGTDGSVKEGSVQDDDFAHSWFRCSVCLEGKSPSTTSCGHLFCWRCIQEHALTANGDAHCPHCRAVFEPSQVVPLLNL